jgi:hypothetical protein
MSPSHASAIGPNMNPARLMQPRLKTHNPENERIKRRYLALLEEAKDQSVASIDGVAQCRSVRVPTAVAFLHVSGVSPTTGFSLLTYELAQQDDSSDYRGESCCSENTVTRSDDHTQRGNNS